MPQHTFDLAGHGPVTLDIRHLVIAGWAGRDRAAVDHHIAELAAIGVKPPSTVPTFYRVASQLLDTGSAVQVPGHDSSGEVECVLLASEAHGVLVGIGSDHTDRTVEAYDVTVSKQMCAKPVGRALWKLSEVQGHWDQLVTRCWRTRDGVRALYQEGALARLLPPAELMQKWNAADGLSTHTAMFCGTHAVIGELGWGEAFELELHDPVLNRSLHHHYATQALEIAR
ncbi:DUF2848 domain-containing protein [Acidovorax sp. SUPP2522]|uniref:DUF2848 domain-containing protein n=1 Tax=unclassified Acidovorax TaxID=2684926 RepID=UPI00234B30CE|nr:MULTISPECIES: DUF2848 domain-containing protein [unclassified Acidovorax]WCM98581.1 DUF2848 domain-containing protein [Acidovorax sp. GBBC 1281]GKT17945.1 DUF2848 domain-containing protein [Acidovorax sp. SUPP2522]